MERIIGSIAYGVMACFVTLGVCYIVGILGYSLPSNMAWGVSIGTGCCNGVLNFFGLLP